MKIRIIDPTYPNRANDIRDAVQQFNEIAEDKVCLVIVKKVTL